LARERIFRRGILGKASPAALGTKRRNSGKGVIIGEGKSIYIYGEGRFPPSGDGRAPGRHPGRVQRPKEQNDEISGRGHHLREEKHIY
jgi:hypothetical protein